MSRLCLPSITLPRTSHAHAPAGQARVDFGCPNPRPMARPCPPSTRNCVGHRRAPTATGPSRASALCRSPPLACSHARVAMTTSGSDARRRQAVGRPTGHAAAGQHARTTSTVGDPRPSPRQTPPAFLDPAGQRTDVVPSISGQASVGW